MNEDVLNLQIRKFLKQFGVSAQRAIEKAVDAETGAGSLRGPRTLGVRATLEITGTRERLVLEEEIALD